MSSIEELYKQKLLNNEFIEEAIGWNENDSYYYESEDQKLLKFLKKDKYSDFGIKTVINNFSQILRKRYHNNFYLEYLPSEDEIVFILRGQPIFESSTINLIVKYVITISLWDCSLTTKFLIPYDKEFENELNYQFSEKKPEKMDIINNSENIPELLDSISLHDFVKKVNENSSITKEKSNENKSTETTSEVKESVIYCQNCGKKNYFIQRECTNCKTTLITPLINYGDEITSYDEILSEEAIKKIEKTEIPLDFYEYVIETISKKCENIDFSEDVNVYDQLIHISRRFVNVDFDYDYDNKYNPYNEEVYGKYNFDTVYINPNYSYSQQCSSLIKYIAIEIHLEILEAFLMYIFDVKNNAFVRNFIDYTRFTNLEEEKIIQKYYPIQVESHFIPEKYWNYEEIRPIENRYVYDKNLNYDMFLSLLTKGNSIAKDIIKILDNIITGDIKEKLALQFEKDEELTTSWTKNIQETLSAKDTIKLMKNNIVETIKILKENENLLKKFYEDQSKFEGKGNSI